MYRSNIVGGVAAKKAGKPVVWGIHCSSLDPLTPRSRALARLGGVLARWIPDFIINCSTRSAELHRKLGYSTAPGAVVHNGYDPAIWFADETARAVARNALGVDRDDFVIGNVARWHVQKDIPNLLAALRIARDRGVSSRGFLIGVGLGGENPDLAHEISRHGCDEYVVPLGARPDIAHLARALDLHVLASCGAEAFPNVVAETMLSGTPNVVTDVGDAALIVADTGWVAPPRDPDGLADAIVRAFEEWRDAPERWQRRREAASARITENFSLDRMAGEYETIWRKLARK
jgi:glycosyltransferase involved in cell wall biosynthesis